MSKVLVVTGHTDLNGASVVNKTIVSDLRKALPNAEFSVLSDLYPDFKIDVEKEQKKVLEADVIVFQFPVFWYSMPSLLRRWIEDVFTHGFAFGATGDKVKGKRFIASFTTGSPEELYQKDGMYGLTIEELFSAQLRPMAVLCGLDLKPFIYTAGVSFAAGIPEETLLDAAKVQAEEVLKAVESK